MATSVDVSALRGFADAMREAPVTLRRKLAVAYQQIAAGDIAEFRAKLPSELNVSPTSKVQYAFNAVASNPVQAKSLRDLFVDEYTRWVAARVLQTGEPTIEPIKGLNLALRFADNGVRPTIAELQQMLASGRAMFVKIGGRTLIFEVSGGRMANKGYVKGGKRGKLIGMLRDSVKLEKHIDFIETFNSRESIHNDLMQTAVDETLDMIQKGTAR